jgi:hypothetical protein
MIDLFESTIPTLPENLGLYTQAEILLLLIIVFIAIMGMAEMLYRIMHPPGDDKE